MEPVTTCEPLVIVYVIAVAPAPTHEIVALVPVPVTVATVALPPLNATVGVVLPPVTDTPTADCVPATQLTAVGLAVTTKFGGVIDTSSPQAARPKPAVATTSVRQLTSLIR
jgi:hypothetical protein